MKQRLLRLYVSIQTRADAAEDRDRGSNSVETAIIVGLVATAAIGLTTLMTGAIDKFGGMIP